MTPKNILPRTKIADFIDNLACQASVVRLVSASLAMRSGKLAQALGKLSKHGVNDRLLSNQGIDVWEFFGYWIPYLVGARTEVVVRWTGRAREISTPGRS